VRDSAVSDLTSGRVDVVITCGLIPAPDGIANEVFCAEPLLVGLRPEHRLAAQPAVALTDLAHDVLGTTPADLFPGWALSQRQALEQAGISPPTIDLADTDLTATRWAEQQDIGRSPVRARRAHRRAAAGLAHPAGSSAPSPRPGAVAPG
jgi:DNA-binding transcriptional LysR family regulator